MKKNKYILCLVAIFLIAACTDILETTPKSGIVNDASFFKTTADFDAFMFGAYIDVGGSFDGSGVANWIRIGGNISQDIYSSDQIPKPITQYLTASNGYLSSYWKDFYKISAKANQILAKLPGADIPAEDKTRLEGEALFFRGFAYFNIARAFGNAPLILTPFDISQNIMECTPEAQIWDQVIADLTAAAPKIPALEDWGSDNLGRATKGAVYAFLANAYMYKEDWANAETASNSLIALGNYSLMPDVRSVFSLANQNNVESIFEVQYRDILNGKVNWNGNGEAGSVLPEYTSPRNIGNEWAPAAGWGEMTGNIKLADSFEPGDDRRAKLIVATGEEYTGELMTSTLVLPENATWDRSCFSTKYWYGPSDVPGDDYLFRTNVPVMRYAEFLLNYAEILFKQGKTAQAYDQLNLVRERALLPDLAESADEATFMTALMKERRAELNFECNLWFHFTRTGTAANFLQSEHGVTWNPAWSKLPIPQSERDQNPNLCQNTGY
jgi:hypothetical protein